MKDIIGDELRFIFVQYAKMLSTFRSKIAAPELTLYLSFSRSRHFLRKIHVINGFGWIKILGTFRRIFSHFLFLAFDAIKGEFIPKTARLIAYSFFGASADRRSGSAYRDSRERRASEQMMSLSNRATLENRLPSQKREKTKQQTKRKSEKTWAILFQARVGLCSAAHNQPIAAVCARQRTWFRFRTHTHTRTYTRSHRFHRNCKIISPFHVHNFRFFFFFFEANCSGHIIVLWTSD